MAFQSGVVDPIAYHRDNSGVNTDTTTPISYTPQEFGAPLGARIITGTVDQSYSVTRGTAYVTNLVIQESGISFEVYTQAAGGGLFGHHSGRNYGNNKFPVVCAIESTIYPHYSHFLKRAVTSATSWDCSYRSPGPANNA